MSTLIDISPSLRVGMGVFPGDALFAVSQTFSIGPECPVNVASISMSTHCGAHVDAPKQYWRSQPREFKDLFENSHFGAR